MDIKDELDLMLNNLKKSSSSPVDEEPAKPINTFSYNTTNKKVDSMSVDDILNALSAKKSLSKPDKTTEKAVISQIIEEAPKKVEQPVFSEPVETPERTEKAVLPKTIEDIPQKVEQPVFPEPVEEPKRAVLPKQENSEIETISNSEDISENSLKSTKKKIIINHELPDYDESILHEDTPKEPDLDESNEEVEIAPEPKAKKKGGLFSKLKSALSSNKTDAVEDAAKEVDDTEDERFEEFSEELIPNDELEEALIEDSVPSFADTFVLPEVEKVIDTMELEIPENTDVSNETNATEDVISKIDLETKQVIDELSADESVDETIEEVVENSEDSIEELEPVKKTPKKSKLLGTLEKILEQNPDEISQEKKEESEPDEEVKTKTSYKKYIYSTLGVIFTIFAIVGFVFSVYTGIMYLRNLTSSENIQNEFQDAVYPAVIMDIEAFQNGNELSSSQIIQASIWKMIMSNDMEKYTKTFDVISVPAVDIEAVATRLFAADLINIQHQTVGSGEVKFYYNAESNSYNIPATPFLFSYKPVISAVSKNNDIYTVEVEYMKESPYWMTVNDKFESEVSKVVKFKLKKTESDYAILSMEILKINVVD